LLCARIKTTPIAWRRVLLELKILVHRDQHIELPGHLA